MRTSKTGISFIKTHESCRLLAYRDIGGTPTIGWGCIKYEDGRPVKVHDVITQKKADELLMHEITIKEQGVTHLLGDVVVNQNQFDALVSFAYNLGIGALAGSTLLKKVKANPDDPTISEEFLKWAKYRKNGKLEESASLLSRRWHEANLYFKSI